MNYNQTLDFLFASLPSFDMSGVDGYKPGLERITAFCRHLGNPQRNFFTIHIAGTNGKGSVAHMIASILDEAGYRVGLYTSPHLTDFRERIRINGEMIPKQRIVNFVDKHHQKMVELGLSFFEMTTALAFESFAHDDVEVAVIETGLGGRLDATNIITPILSIITNVALDHTSLLGDNLEQIAAEKGGIIKKSIPVILGEANIEYDEILEGIAKANRSKFIYAEHSFSALECERKECAQHFTLQRESDGYRFGIEIDLVGHCQERNLITVAAAANFLHEETPLTISRRAFLAGLRSAAKSTSLQGRWQRIAEAPLTICDTAHNAHGIEKVCQQIEATPHKKLYCVVGFCTDKDIDKMLDTLPKGAHYIFTKADTQRGTCCDELLTRAAQKGLQGEAIASVKGAYEKARELAKEEDMIFIGGSNFVVAELLDAVREYQSATQI